LNLGFGLMPGLKTCTLSTLTMIITKKIAGAAILTLYLTAVGYIDLRAQQTDTQFVFKKGWAIGLNQSVKYPRYARTEFPTDSVVSRLIDDGSMRISKSMDFTSKMWAPIEADEKGVFKSEQFDYGILYLEFESPREQIMIFDGSGHGKVYINGVPREGDHFGFGITKHPVKIKKGVNTFYMTGGRNPEMRASLYTPPSPQLLVTDQVTLPDLVVEESGSKWAGIKIINATDRIVTGMRIESNVNGSEKVITDVAPLERLSSKLVPFRINELEGVSQKEVNVQLTLLSGSGKILSSATLTLKNLPFNAVHDRTFISAIDGSVQYYTVNPGNLRGDEAPALFFSAHGAGVEARNQAAVYTSKDWGHLIAATNRGSFGFAWEDWGRLDALEVLAIGKELFQPDPQKIFLTGHSMGGHASWYLGATYPDLWAAIGPSAGYAELHEWIEHTRKSNTAVQRMFGRAGNPQRTLLLQRNYRHFGVYVNHGDADQVVPVTHARQMKRLLAEFHPDFEYYEYSGGGHWYGNISADWPPLFEFFRNHQQSLPSEVRHLEFHTASPGVSASSNWVTIYQQTHPFQPSHINLQLGVDSSSILGLTENVAVLRLDFEKASVAFPLTIQIDGTRLPVEQEVSEVWMVRTSDGEWKLGAQPTLREKGPHRYGNFKDAFRHEVVFVYGTKGTQEENDWNFYKARYDAETFSYRGNGSIEVVSDRQFSPENYKDRGVIIYGNASTNSAWESLLGDSPVQVSNGEIRVGERIWTGDGWGCYFIRTRPDSDVASVGVVAGSGLRGFKSAHANQYFLAGTAFPDLTAFGADIWEKEYEAVVATGFFGNDWSVEKGEFEW